MNTSRAELFGELTRCLPRPRANENVLIAIDGVDGAGKTTFAHDLMHHLKTDRPTITLSIDGFHHVRARRHRQGRTSPEGFWLDSYDYDSFRRNVVNPFRARVGTYLPAAHDVDSDRHLDSPRLAVPSGVTVLVDGIFLQRAELADIWDATIFLDVPFVVSTARMARRDGGSADPRSASNARYVEGQQLYLSECRPAEKATILIDNTDWRCPTLVRSARAPRLRLATARDFGAIEAIENAADRLLVERLQPEAWPPAGSRADDPGFVLVAEEESAGGVIGFVHVLEVDGLAHLEQISVLPEFGGRGHGRALLTAARQGARDRGYRRLTLRTYADVPWNAPFYATAGFAIEPATTKFHRSLIDVEKRLGLDRHGRRVQMGVDLD